MGDQFGAQGRSSRSVTRRPPAEVEARLPEHSVESVCTECAVVLNFDTQDPYQCGKTMVGGSTHTGPGMCCRCFRECGFLAMAYPNPVDRWAANACLSCKRRCNDEVEQAKRRTVEAVREEIRKEYGDYKREGGSEFFGAIFAQRCEFAPAFRSQQQRLSHAQGSGNKQGQAAAYSCMGNLLQTVGDFNGAIEMHEAGLQLLEELGDDGGSQFGNLGQAYFSLGLHSKALECHTKYLALARDGTSVCRARVNIASAHLALGHTALALEISTCNLAEASNVPDRREREWALIRAYRVMGLCCCTQGDFPTSLAMLTCATAQAEASGDALSHGNALHDLAAVLLASGSSRNLRSAVEILTRALECQRRVERGLESEDVLRIHLLDRQLLSYQLLQQVGGKSKIYLNVFYSRVNQMCVCV